MKMTAPAREITDILKKLPLSEQLEIIWGLDTVAKEQLTEMFKRVEEAQKNEVKRTR